jgi:predicted transcriptional regulator
MVESQVSSQDRSSVVASEYVNLLRQRVEQLERELSAVSKQRRELQEREEKLSRALKGSRDAMEHQMEEEGVWSVVHCGEVTIVTPKASQETVAVGSRVEAPHNPGETKTQAE